MSEDEAELVIRMCHNISSLKELKLKDITLTDNMLRYVSIISTLIQLCILCISNFAEFLTVKLIVYHEYTYHTSLYKIEPYHSEVSIHHALNSMK